MSDDLPRIRVVSAELARDGRYLLTRRKPDAVLGGLWEFPGGRVRDQESDEEALHRALRDRIGVEPVLGDCSMSVEHRYDHYVLTLVVYRCTLADDAEPVAARVADLAWAGPEEFADYTFPGADQQTVDALLGDM